MYSASSCFVNLVSDRGDKALEEAHTFFAFFSFLISQKNLKFKTCIKTRRILHYADFKTVGTVADKCLGKQCFGGKLLQFFISFVCREGFL